MKLKFSLLTTIFGYLFISSNAFSIENFSKVISQVGNPPQECVENKESKRPDPSEMQYFSQYKNLKNPNGTCQNTSVAMVAKFLQPNRNKSLTPDKVYRDQGGNARAKSPSGAASVLRDYGVPYTKSTNRGTLKDLKYHLSQGRPAIVNGYFTAGHVVVVTGYDPFTDEFIVNDPAGVWNQKFMGGYRGQSKDGKQVRYKASTFTKAVTPNGSHDLWMAVGSNRDFKLKAPRNFKYPKKAKVIANCHNVSENNIMNRTYSASLPSPNYRPASGSGFNGRGTSTSID